MKKLLFLSLILLSVSSCKKDEQDPNNLQGEYFKKIIEAENITKVLISYTTPEGFIRKTEYETISFPGYNYITLGYLKINPKVTYNLNSVISYEVKYNLFCTGCKERYNQLWLDIESH